MKDVSRPIKNLPRKVEEVSIFSDDASGRYYQDGMTVPLYFSRMNAFTSGL